MKHMRTFLLFCTIIGVVACSNDDDAIKIDNGLLPQQSQDFIEAHFGGATIVKIEKNTIPESDGTVYEVKLSNGFELDFDIDGQWIEVDGNKNRVPDAIIPKPILNYVNTNYGDGVFIESIEKKTYGYKIDLSNGLELKFNVQGEFIGIDD